MTADPLAVVCPKCRAPKGHPCRSPKGKPKAPCKPRVSNAVTLVMCGLMPAREGSTPDARTA